VGTSNQTALGDGTNNPLFQEQKPPLLTRTKLQFSFASPNSGTTDLWQQSQKGAKVKYFVLAPFLKKHT
jgi:hypothetical protein